jgi:hypothetical protein
MKNFLHSHPGVVIGTLAIAFVVVLAGFFSWAIGDIFNQMGRALAAPTAQSVVGFDLSGASKLNLRGLMNSAASTSAPTTSATSSAFTTSSSTPTP